MILSKSNLKTKKYSVLVNYTVDNKKRVKTVQFGQKNAEDYTTH